MNRNNKIYFTAFKYLIYMDPIQQLSMRFYIEFLHHTMAHMNQNEHGSLRVLSSVVAEFFNFQMVHFSGKEGYHNVIFPFFVFSGLV